MEREENKKHLSMHTRDCKHWLPSRSKINAGSATTNTGEAATRSQQQHPTRAHTATAQRQLTPSTTAHHYTHTHTHTHTHNATTDNKTREQTLTNMITNKGNETMRT